MTGNNSWHDTLFPQQNIFNRQWGLGEQFMLFVGLVGVFSLIGVFIPPNGFVAFDWVHFFSIPHVPPFYPPWDAEILRWLNWPLFFGLSMGGIGLAVLKRARHVISAVAALLTLPLLWTMFLGQLEGLVVVGILGLPYLVPLALLKPQVSAFSLLAKRKYLIAGVLWLLVSVAIWGVWPVRMLHVNQFYALGRPSHDISLGIWGVLFAVPMLWLSRGDEDMLMISGTFMTLHLLPYNMLPFVPAIARLRPKYAIIAAVLSWLPLSAEWLGKSGWWLGWLFVIWLWLGLFFQRYRQRRLEWTTN